MYAIRGNWDLVTVKQVPCKFVEGDYGGQMLKKWLKGKMWKCTTSHFGC